MFQNFTYSQKARWGQILSHWTDIYKQHYCYQTSKNCRLYNVCTFVSITQLILAITVCSPIQCILCRTQTVPQRSSIGLNTGNFAGWLDVRKTACSSALPTCVWNDALWKYQFQQCDGSCWHVNPAVDSKWCLLPRNYTGIAVHGEGKIHIRGHIPWPLIVLQF